MHKCVHPSGPSAARHGGHPIRNESAQDSLLIALATASGSASGEREQPRARSPRRPTHGAPATRRRTLPAAPRLPARAALAGGERPGRCTPIATSGTLASYVFGGAINTGVVDRFRSLPIARSAVLIGRTAADAVVNVMTVLVMVLVGVAVGFRPDQPVYDLALALAPVLGFAYVFSWISAFVGLTVRDPEAAQAVGFIWVFPLTFASSAFVPTSSMPGACSGSPTSTR
jgi:ABC-2 type transporter